MSTTKTILLVDDDPDILDQNKVLLESRGYEVVTASNSDDGFAEFEKIKPYAVVLDLMMEQYDSGFILSHKIKRTAHGKTTPVYIITSVATTTGMKFDSETGEETEWINADGILNKPVVIEDLVTKIESFYAHKHENSSN